MVVSLALAAATAVAMMVAFALAAAFAIVMAFFAATTLVATAFFMATATAMLWMFLLFGSLAHANYRSHKSHILSSKLVIEVHNHAVVGDFFYQAVDAISIGSVHGNNSSHMH